MFSEDLNQKYLEAQRDPDGVQLNVKLSTKLPNKSWQTLLNFLNIGHSGVSLCLIFVCFINFLSDILMRLYVLWADSQNETKLSSHFN